MPWLLSPAFIVSAAVAVAGSGFAGGFYVSNTFCKAKVEAIQIAQTKVILELKEKNLDIIKEIQDADDAQAEKDAKRIAELEGLSRDLVKAITPGVCLSPADVQRLRDYFNRSR